MSKSFIVTDDSMKPDSCYECGAEKKWIVLKHGETADHDAWWECVVCEAQFPVVRLFDISEEEPPVFDFDEDDDIPDDGELNAPLRGWWALAFGGEDDIAAVDGEEQDVDRIEREHLQSEEYGNDDDRPPEGDRWTPGHPDYRGPNFSEADDDIDL